MTHDFMNMPDSREYQAKIINSWVICPFCGKKNFPVTPGAVIHGQFFRCRGSNCKKDFEVNTETESQTE